jgi:hypothetical protein
MPPFDTPPTVAAPPVELPARLGSPALPSSTMPVGLPPEPSWPRLGVPPLIAEGGSLAAVSSPAVNALPLHAVAAKDINKSQAQN